MKKHSVLMTVIFLATFNFGIFGYDDFPVEMLDPLKWENLEFGRYVEEKEGQGVLFSASRSLKAGEYKENILNIENPINISAIRSDLKVDQFNVNVLNPTDIPEVRASVRGKFYKTEIDPEDPDRYYVLAEISLFSRGGQLGALWRVFRITQSEPTLTYEELHRHEFELTEPLSTSQFYTIELKCHLKYGDLSAAIYPQGNPEPIASNSYSNENGLETIEGQDFSLVTASENGDAWIVSFFDNVDIIIGPDGRYQNHDDFDPVAPLDIEKWDNGERLCLVDNGKLRMKLATDGEDRITQRINLMDRSDYLEAKVQIKSNSSFMENSGNMGRARIYSPLYNDTNETASQVDETGNIWGKIQLDVKEDRSITASCTMEKCLNENCEDSTNLLVETFNDIILDYDTEYTLSIEKKENTITFQINDQIHQYQIPPESSIYEIEDAKHSLIARIYGDEISGDRSVFDVTYDDVKIIKESNENKEINPNNKTNAEDFLEESCFITTLSGSRGSARLLITLIASFFLISSIFFEKVILSRYQKDKD